MICDRLGCSLVRGYLALCFSFSLFLSSYGLFIVSSFLFPSLFSPRCVRFSLLGANAFRVAGSSLSSGGVPDLGLQARQGARLPPELMFQPLVRPAGGEDPEVVTRTALAHALNRSLGGCKGADQGVGHCKYTSRPSFAVFPASTSIYMLSAQTLTHTRPSLSLV